MAYTTITNRNNKARSGIALGGIGSGWFELRQDGLTHDWNIFNNQPLSHGEPFTWDTSSMLFFTIRYQEKGKTPKVRLLQIENKYGAAAIRSHEHYYMVPWLSGVDTIEYSGTFPYVTMRCTDRAMPFVVEIEAWSPFIPHDVKNSSLPAAVFNVKVTSKTSNPVDVMIVASLRNAVGYDVPERSYVSRITEGAGYKAFEMTCDNLPENHPSAGTMGIASLSPSSTYYLGWEHHHPYYEVLINESRLPNIDDTAGRSYLDGRTGKRMPLGFCLCSIANSKKLNGKNSSFEHTFVTTWCFPNNPSGGGRRDDGTPSHIEGHYYGNFFSSSFDVADYMAANLKMLSRKTAAFRDSFYDSSAPLWLLDQINSNLNTLHTSTWLTKEKHFGIVEGLNTWQAFSTLSTIDVAMYGSVSWDSLFPELAKDVMAQYGRFQAPNDSILHSIPTNFKDPIPEKAYGGAKCRLDMAPQFAFMSLRTFFWSGDMDFLRTVWPQVKNALDYVLNLRDMNGDCLPDMEGIMCSYDNFPMYGVAPYVATQFLAGAFAAVEAAKILGDTEAQRKYSDVVARGAKVLEDRAWNGKYYRLFDDRGGSKGTCDEGCLTDQIIGQWGVHQTGLGYFLDPVRVKTALKNIMAMNYKPDYGLRNCQWPGDGFLHAVDKDTWVDQANTVWTGVELAFVSFLLYEGMYADAMKVAKNVDDRYRYWGMYWDHQEFGGHYMRPLSAWLITHGLLGLQINNGRYSFAPRMPGKKLRLFFSFAGGYGHYEKQTAKTSEAVSLSVEEGSLKMRELLVQTGIRPKKAELKIGKKAVKGATITCAGQTVQVVFATELAVPAGGTVELKATV